MKIAVIDLGTNTCNLLIAETDQSGYKVLHQSKQWVKLGDKKISDNEICAEATKRAIEAFRVHKQITKDFGVEKVRVIATSAIRTANNKISFLDQLSNDSGWIIKIVPGEKEAELIFNGVLLAFDKLNEPSVILDIGGGSNELILAHEKCVLWKESQPAGMARVINRFTLSNPISQNEIKQLQNFFLDMHKNAFEKCISAKISNLIGCSGAFDTIVDMIDCVNPGEKQRRMQEILIADFYIIFEKLIHSTREQRICMKGMDMVRVDLIVPAVILIEHLISTVGITKIIQTDYALREGVLFELMQNQGKCLS